MNKIAIIDSETGVLTIITPESYTTDLEQWLEDNYNLTNCVWGVFEEMVLE